MAKSRYNKYIKYIYIYTHTPNIYRIDKVFRQTGVCHLADGQSQPEGWVEDGVPEGVI